MEDSKKKKKGIRLTERDLQILRWLNSHRAATSEQIHKKFGMSLAAAKKRLSELKSSEYLAYEKIFHNKPGVYRVDTKGIAVTNDELPIARIRLGTYQHDLDLVDLAIVLENKTGAVWRTDRQIRHDNGVKGVGAKGHSPDGILEFPSGDKIAVELELSSKGTRRLENILKEYANSHFKEVWYFASSESIASKVTANSSSMIKVFSWPTLEEFKAKANKSAEPITTTEEQKTKDFFRRR